MNAWTKLAFPVFLLLASAFCATQLSRGWIPNDEGVLAQLAERTLQGELSHRDFDEPYSGGLNWINATAFRLFGTRLRSMRIPLLAFYLLFLTALYGLARRWVPPVEAALFGMLCLGWGLPAYFAALPSWYNSCFAGYGTWMLMKHIETRQRRWLFFAGLMGGLSFCMKVVGLYFLAAGIIFLVYQEKILDRDEAPPGDRSLPAAPIMLVIQGAVCLLAVAALLTLLGKRLDINTAIHFLLPGAILASLPLVDELRAPGAAWPNRVRRLAERALIFSAGFVLPVMAFTFYFWRAGAMHALLADLFILPYRRLLFAFHPLPSLWTLWLGLPPSLLLWYSAVRRPPWPRSVEWLLAGSFLAVAFLGNHARVYSAVWLTPRMFVPVWSVAGVVALSSRSPHFKLSAIARTKFFLILVVTAFVSLVQFPLSLGFYFCYVSAFVALSALALFKSFSRSLFWTRMGIMAAYGVFGLMWIAHGEVFMIGQYFYPRRASTLLLPERAGLRVGAFDAAVYTTVVKLIREHSAASEFILAGPDCPEIYFLAQKKNPTRVFYEFFAPEHASSAVLLQAIADHHITVFVYNQMGEFSDLAPGFLEQVSQHFPHSQKVGRFQVFW